MGNAKNSRNLEQLGEGLPPVKFFPLGRRVGAPGKTPLLKFNIARMED